MNTVESMQKRFTLLNQNQDGFSLIEMLIVITLMAVAGVTITTQLFKRLEEGRVSTTKTQIRQLGLVLDDFRRVCGFYPTQEQGLEALIKPPVGRECKNYDPEGFLKEKKVPQDPWGTPYSYESDGSKYVLKSLGADRKEGGDNYDKDITSENLD